MAWFAWFETLADASPHHDAVEWAAKTLVMMSRVTMRSGPSDPRLEPRKDPHTAIFQTVCLERDELKPNQKPLFLAKAGIQILWRKTVVISGGLLSFDLSFVIWIPAFAGMSGVYIGSI